jgi:hypothetical protein
MRLSFQSSALIALMLFTFPGGGCANSYATPGRAADLKAVGLSPEAVADATDAGIKQALEKKPLASLPTGIAVVRLQAPDYRSSTAQGFGTGRYSVVTTRDIESPDAMARLERLPKVTGIAAVNRVILPSHFDSDQELRHAAAQLHADMLLVYTLDTTFQKNDLAEPLTLITLGISPNQKATIVTTASAVLMDTRNGYVYGVCEATARTSKMMGAWGSSDAIDETRLKVEAQAFEKLVGEFEKTWTGVVREMSPLTGASRIQGEGAVAGLVTGAGRPRR